MAWYDFIAIQNLDTSLTDEEAATTAPPDEDAPADLAPCPAQYFEVFTGISGGSGTSTETPGEDISTQLQAWLNAVETWFGLEETWLDAARLFSEEPEGTRGDLPAPIPPQLPDLVDFVSLPALIAQFGPAGIIVFVGIQVLKRVLEAWIEKKANPGVGELKAMLQDIRDAIKKGLLFNDGADSTLSKAFLFGDGVEGANAAILKSGLLFADTDGKQKGALDRGLLYTQDNVTQGVLKSGLLFTDVFDSKLKGALERGLLKEVTIMVGETPTLTTISILELMKMSIDDLAFVDAILDFGFLRVHIKGKAIEY